LHLAVDNYPGNFPAWIDLFSCVLAKYRIETKVEVEDLLKRMKGSEHGWTSFQLGHLSFFEGIVEFLKKGGSKRNALVCWLRSISLGYEVGFKVIGFFNWNHKLLFNLKLIKGFLGIAGNKSSIFLARGEWIDV